MHDCHQYLRDNGYAQDFRSSKDEYESGGFPESVETFIKHFDGYTIQVISRENECGGREDIHIYLDPPSTSEGASKPYRRMAAPSISFFATGYHDYAAMEKKAKKMVKVLRSWAIEVI